MIIPKKRKSGGKVLVQIVPKCQTGSSKGNYGKVQCAKCGRFVARVLNISLKL